MIILTPDAKYKFVARDNDKDDEAVVKETWVEDVYHIHRGLLDDTGVVIDIGANIGAVSIYCASLDEGEEDMPSVTVYAYEPEPHNLKLLEQNIKLNGKGENIKVFPIAVSGRRESLRISNESGGSAVVGKETKDATDVPAIRLEDVFADNKISNCDLLKIDVEGHEYDILLSTRDEILQKCAHIRVEFDKRTKDHPELFGELITKLCKSFNVHIIGSPERGGNIYADRY